MQKESNYKEERTDLIVGIVTIIITLALFAWLVASIGRNARQEIAANTVGEITVIGETRRGSEQTFTYTPDRTDIMDGAYVQWTVDGEPVYEGAYLIGEPLTLNYTPTQTGAMEIGVKVGNYHQMTTVEVLSPRLTITAPCITLTYGEPLPKVDYAVSGFVPGEDVSDFCYDGHCITDCDKLNVGVYELKFENDCCYRDYEIEYVCGKLTILPKQLQVTNNFVKIYDGTNTIDNPTLTLDGIVEGDEVCAKCETLYFDNKNVGNDKTIMLANVCLEGKDANNYVLPDYASGNVTPRQLKVVGMTVKDKIYDGTTKATIDKMATLSGVIDGDSVAIGGLNVSFDNASVGKQSVTTRSITLIGADKDNYIVVEVEKPTAHIRNSNGFWDKILDREPVAQGSQLA
ncbi:MAG: hypothetical protein J1G02_01265 [Clostridiales bacterium]|nr:hypothetical protein [Clostridiales bacterium]